jgi:hypothetical protein
MPPVMPGIVWWSFAAWSKRREDSRQNVELAAIDQVEVLDDFRRQACFECLGEDGERQVALEFGRASGQCPVATVLAPAQGLAYQGGLAYSGFARDHDGGTLAGADGVEQPVEGAQLPVTPDQLCWSN